MVIKKLEQHLRVLCEEIGARPTGSQANHDAVDYVCQEFEKYGLSVERQTFDCMDWIHTGGSLAVCGQDISVVPAPYSLVCHVQGEIICVHSLEELRCTQIAGKIVLLCDALTSEPLMPKSFVFWNPDQHKEIISLLEAGKPLAVLTESLSPERSVPVIEDGDFTLPCGIIIPESISAFYDGAAASLTINALRKPSTGDNVIATYGSGEHKVCFSAHIDTKEGTPGALDNASGTAVLLALASELAPHEYPYRIEFVLFNGEDYYSNPGEMSYLASNLTHPEEYVCAYNIDGVGLKDQKISYSFYDCPEKLVSNISNSAADLREFKKVEPWPQGDHMLFSSAGIPAIAISSCGIFRLVDRVLHSAGDTRDLVDVEKLETLVGFLLYSV